MKQLILGSSSPFRAELLAKLHLPFTTASPDIDETALQGETPEELVLCLSESKAKAIAEKYPGLLIIGSDQVAVLDSIILGKPGTHENAMNQLRQASGKTVSFVTGLCLYDSDTGSIQNCVDYFSVEFKPLSDNQIDFYLKTEQPYQCAGSFKSEGFGISLFNRLIGDDPNTLIGLPLIKLIAMLKAEGIDVLQPNA